MDDGHFGCITKFIKKRNTRQKKDILAKNFRKRLVSYYIGARKLGASWCSWWRNRCYSKILPFFYSKLLTYLYLTTRVKKRHRYTHDHILGSKAFSLTIHISPKSEIKKRKIGLILIKDFDFNLPQKSRGKEKKKKSSDYYLGLAK